MGLFVFVLAAFGAWVGITRGQLDEGECSFTFSVPADQLQTYCQQNAQDLVANELVQGNREIAQENKQLRKDLEAMRAEYKGMVDTVKKLESETASWRQVFEWPMMEDRFRPDNETLIISESPTYEDCQAVAKAGNKKAGIYLLEPEGTQTPFFAFCEAGWTLFLRRFDGQIDFYNYWDDYMSGFGELSGEFWLGLEHIHMLTTNEPHYLYVEALGYNGKLYHALHEDFVVGDEAGNYVLSVGNMTEGNYLDVMTELSGTAFSTRDMDNDEWGRNNCADYYRGGWWLKNCGFDPNRRYCRSASCMAWGERPVEKIIMQVRPMSAGPPKRQMGQKKAKKPKKPKRQN